MFNELTRKLMTVAISLAFLIPGIAISQDYKDIMKADEDDMLILVEISKKCFDLDLKSEALSKKMSEETAAERAREKEYIETSTAYKEGNLSGARTQAINRVNANITRIHENYGQKILEVEKEKNALLAELPKEDRDILTSVLPGNKKEKLYEVLAVKSQEHEDIGAFKQDLLSYIRESEKEAGKENAIVMPPKIKDRSQEMRERMGLPPHKK